MSLTTRMISVMTVAGLAAALVRGAELPDPTFKVPFDGSASPTVAVGTRVHPDLKTDGLTFVEGREGQAVVLGAVDPLVYQAGGNIPDEATVSFWVKPLGWESLDRWRYLLALIPKGRSIMYLAHYPRKPPVLQFLWTPSYSPGHETTEEALTLDAWNHVAVAWDGVRSRVYINGAQVVSRPHPSGFRPAIPERATLQLGGMTAGVSSGGSYASVPWGQADTAVDELTVYPGALDAVQIAALAGQVKDGRPRQGPAHERQQIALPKMVEPPAIDGQLGAQEWHHALALPPLIDGNHPGASFDYPPQTVRLGYDDANLYVAIRSEFPAGAQIPRGGTRASLDDPDEEVWDDESFELWLSTVDAQTTYRFAGNVAGGFAEMKNKDTTWNGPWVYRRSVSMTIHSADLWQAEIAIPWATIGMQGDSRKSFLLNVCRTWRSLPQLGVTSIGGAPGYPNTDHFAAVHTAPAAPALIFQGSGSPSTGSAEHTWILRNGTPDPVEVALGGTLLADLPDNDVVLVDTVVSLPPGGEESVTVPVGVTDSIFQRVGYRVVSAAGDVLLRYSVPFELRADFLDAIPLLSQNAVLVRPAVTLYRSRLEAEGASAAAFTVRLVGPNGEVLAERPAEEGEELRLALPADGPYGEYRVQLAAVNAAAAAPPAERRFQRPAPPVWLTQGDDILDRVLPPFEPLRIEAADDQALSVACWGRRYQFDGRLLPTAMISADAGDLLTAPVTLMLGDTAAGAATVTLDTRSDTRAEMTMVADGPAATVRNATWIEYDGVMVHRITVDAKTDLESVALRIPLRADIARFGHFASGGFGAGGGMTRALDEGVSTAFYPVVWAGNFERGLAWFCEGGADMGSGLAKPISFAPAEDTTTMTVQLWGKLDAGQSASVRFGFVATPVKPLHPRYPLNIFARDALWDDPPAVPLFASVVWNPRNFFQDIPYYDPRRGEMVTAGELLREQDQATPAKLMPYMTPYTITSEYPAAVQYKREWELVPVRHDDSPTRQIGKDETRPWTELWLSPASESYRRYYAWKLGQTIKQTGIEAVYFDFGCAFPDSNRAHGAHGGFPLLGMRDFYRRVANEFVKAGIEDYVIVSHNSQAVQIPAMTFVTHFYNGEHLRTSSSPTLHEGRDYLDTLPLYYFGIEQSGLPWGIHANMLVEFDEAEHLVRRVGVNDETVAEYLWNRTPSVVMPILLHGCLPDGYRLSLPYYKSVAATLHGFDIPTATFHPYWKNSDRIQVDHGQVRVSAYARPESPRVLLVVGNLDDEAVETTVRLDLQDFFDWDDSSLAGMSRVAKKGELMQVRELIGARDARILDVGPHHVKLWIRGHAMALVEVAGHIRIR